MKNFRELIRTTLIGGVLFLIPLVFVAAILGKAFQLMKVVAKPLSKLLPYDSAYEYIIVETLTVLLILVCCLLAGILARSAWAKSWNQKLDAVLLELIPGYSWVKGFTGDISDADATKALKPVLVRYDDQSQLAFEVERTADGIVAVYLPGSPDYRSGAVSYVEKDRVRPIDASFKGVVDICKNLGRDSVEVLSGHIA